MTGLLTARIVDWLGYQRHRLLREHDLCEPGCWETAKDWFPHCWKCGARMKYEPTEDYSRNWTDYSFAWADEDFKPSAYAPEPKTEKEEFDERSR